MQNALPSVGDLYSTAFNRLKTNYWYYAKSLVLVLLMFTVIMLGFLVVFGILFGVTVVYYPYYTGTEISASVLIAQIAFNLVLIITLSFLTSWAASAIWSIFSNPTHVSAATHMAYAWKRTPTMLGAILLSNIMITIGTILFILPGIYLYIRNLFIQIAVVKNQITISEAFEQSKAVSAGRWWKIFGHTLAVIIPIITLLTLLLVLFILTDNLAIIFIGFLITTVTASIFLSLYFLALFEAATQQPQTAIEA